MDSQELYGLLREELSRLREARIEVAKQAHDLERLRLIETSARAFVQAEGSASHDGPAALRTFLALADALKVPHG